MAYNTEECGWDGGDCVELNTKYPNCHAANPSNIGDGYCEIVEDRTLKHADGTVEIAPIDSIRVDCCSVMTMSKVVKE